MPTLTVFTPAYNRADTLSRTYESMCCQTSKDFVWMIVDDGDLKIDIQEKAKSLGLLSRVIFTGVRSDVSRLLQAMDICVFPSLFEGLPVTMIEVQASGLPSVISDKVPKETVLVKDIIHIMSLSDSAEDWAKQVLVMSSTGRFGRIYEIKESGFDIVEATDWLEKTYYSMIRFS